MKNARALYFNVIMALDVFVHGGDQIVHKQMCKKESVNFPNFRFFKEFLGRVVANFPQNVFTHCVSIWSL